MRKAKTLKHQLKRLIVETNQHYVCTDNTIPLQITMQPQ